MRICGDEVENLPPGFCRGFGELGGAAVEEAVRRVWIDNDLIGNVRLIQFLLELLDGADRDALICSTEEAEDGIFDLLRDIQHGLIAYKGAGQASMEADNACEAQVGARTGEEGERSAHAEAKREGGVVRSLPLAQAVQPGLHILLEGRSLHLLNMGPELKRVVAGRQSGGAAKIVDCQRANALFGEAQSQVFVELVQAAHIGEN